LTLCHLRRIAHIPAITLLISTSEKHLNTLDHILHSH
jgi:hypothetical protein